MMKTKYLKLEKEKILRHSNNDVLTIVSGGNILNEAMKVHDNLKKENINVRIVDLFSIKPVDKVLLRKCAQETGKILVV